MPQEENSTTPGPGPASLLTGIVAFLCVRMGGSFFFLFSPSRCLAASQAEGPIEGRRPHSLSLYKRPSD